jgi:20S proteasome subunit alpha 7
VSRAREEAQAHRGIYGVPMPTRLLAERIASFKHVYTLYSAVRPFGVSSLVAGYDEKGPQLFIVEPNGGLTGYYGYAVGKGQQQAKSSIEKLDLKAMTCRQAIVEIAKMYENIYLHAHSTDCCHSSLTYVLLLGQTVFMKPTMSIVKNLSRLN